ncbi:MAG TPA: FAD-dependent monooxygenase [Ktedonosporobacter sp.]|nr:FAD-dependent monooxygenase [Ktedonosporobacter sp.]
MIDKQIIDVLVVGAGPVGLTLAIDLARHGVTCRIIEQSPTYQIGTRGRGVSMRTQQVFEDLGILDALLPYDEGMAPVRTYDHDKLISESNPASFFPPVPPPYHPILMINQEHTEAVLRARLASYDRFVELGCQLVTFTQNAEGVVANLTHDGRSEEVQARYLVGCDGGHSTVRKAVGISFLGETWDEEHFLLGNVSVSELDTHFSYNWGNLNEGLTLQWMGHSNTWFFSAPLAPDQQGSLPTPTLESLQHLFDERAGIPGVRFSNPRWLSVWRPNIRMVDRYRAGRVFLAGDAAHVNSAAGGQGMNTGVQDAYNLGWKLAQVLNGAYDALLDTYQAERLPVAEGILTTTSFRHREFRRDFSQAVNTLISGKETFADPSQLSITYRGGPLARDLDDTTGIRAGDRAPDATCVRAGSDERIRLFDLFRGTHFTLLLFGSQPLPPLPAAYASSLRVYTIARPDNTVELPSHTLIDSAGHAYRAYGIRGNALILIRPDGYIGLTGGNIRQEPIIDYLHTITGR